MRPETLMRAAAAVLVCAAALPAQITVRSNFENGSIGKIETVGPAHIRCAVVGQADKDHRNRQVSWYYFELNNLPTTPVTVDLVNLAGEYDYKAPAYAVNKGTRPVYSYSGEPWRHFTDEQVSWSDDGPRLTIKFTPQGRRMRIAHTPPYSNRDLGVLLAAVRESSYLTRESIGRTVEGREIQLLTITDPAGPPGKKVIWLMFRQHAWESGSSWVADGAIRYLLSADPGAVRLRSRAIWKIFPMCDPDGVAAGRVRYNANGYDLNRNWDTIDPVKMPEIAAQRKAVLDWVDSGHRLDLFLSLHNTESGEYLQAPAAFKDLGERVLKLLSTRTTFNPTVPLRDNGPTPAAGRMTVTQGLFADRKLPAMLMEQMVQHNSKLGRCPTQRDRSEFGVALVLSLFDAVGAL